MSGQVSSIKRPALNLKIKKLPFIPYLYRLLAPRAFSVIMFGALFCTLVVKFYHSYRSGLIREYFGWIIADIAVLLGIELVLAFVCFRWPRFWAIRLSTFVAFVVCTWSVMNAGWIMRTGMQIFPAVLLPLVRDPLNTLNTLFLNMIKMPSAAASLLVPGSVVLTFFFSVLAKPMLPHYSRKWFSKRVLVFCALIIFAFLARSAVAGRGSSLPVSEGMSRNSQLAAIKSFFSNDSYGLDGTHSASAAQRIPAFDEVKIAPEPQPGKYNIILIVLDGVQYQLTSLGDRRGGLTPYLATLGRQGAEFLNFHTSLPHTTKALFSLLTGQFPSAGEDIAEAVPVLKPYASLVTILRDQLNFRSAFFQSAKGNFEARPGLVYNIGFDKFWAREDLNDQSAFLGYLSSDEFSMIKPIVEWIKASDRPFFLTVLCSASHDPYEVPDWYAQPGENLLERYKQTISYTDQFISALDAEISRLNLDDKTIFCVVGDHGEAFGEHGMFGHERIPFDEVLRTLWVIRAPHLIKPGTRITQDVCSVDLTPTLLALMRFDTSRADFDGVNVLGPVPAERKLYFSCWLQPSPAGFISSNQKFIYDPASNTASVYDLRTDPFELHGVKLDEEGAKSIADEVITWRKNTIFQLDQERSGERMLFNSWHCRWLNRVSSSKYRPDSEN